MTSKAPWPWWHKGTGGDDHRERELLRAIWDLHAVSSTVWLWRGQANAAHDITPGIHTRVKLAGALDDATVVTKTTDLLKTVRETRLDQHEGVRLTDLPLLALIQHHGAATPLLDVSLDPLVALYMAVVSPNQADDGKDGVVFAIRRPAMTIDPFTSETFEHLYDRLPTDAVAMYTAPDVSERLRIQRGHFLIGRVEDTGRSSLPLAIEGKTVHLDSTWLAKLLRKRGQSGGPPAPSTDVGVFKVASSLKADLRVWLEKRTGLTKEFIYPTVWHNPHLDAFCASHGRGAPF